MSWGYPLFDFLVLNAVQLVKISKYIHIKRQIYKLQEKNYSKKKKKIGNLQPESQRTKYGEMAGKIALTT